MCSYIPIIFIDQSSYNLTKQDSALWTNQNARIRGSWAGVWVYRSQLPSGSGSTLFFPIRDSWLCFLTELQHWRCRAGAEPCRPGKTGTERSRPWRNWASFHRAEQNRPENCRAELFSWRGPDPRASSLPCCITINSFLLHCTLNWEFLMMLSWYNKSPADKNDVSLMLWTSVERMSDTPTKKCHLVQMLFWCQEKEKE